MAKETWTRSLLLPPAVESLGRVMVPSFYCDLLAGVKPLLSWHYLPGFIHLDSHLWLMELSPLLFTCSNFDLPP